MAYHLYAYDDYKLALKGRVQHLKELGKPITFRRLSERIPVQYTFLSKVLNQEAHHINQDHLYKLAKLLEFLPEEIDFLDLLRSYGASLEPDRKSFLYERIESLRKQKTVQAEHQGFSGRADLMLEMKYLFEPMAVIVHVALWIEEYRQDPRRLCSVTGIPTTKLKDILNSLDMLGYIELGEHPFEVKKVSERSPHFGRDNPMMRAHQSELKLQLNSRLNQANEDDKNSFMVAFTADAETKKAIDTEFDNFIQKVRELSIKSKEHHLYQMSFDFLKWF